MKLSNKDMKFAYRRSAIYTDDLIVINVTLGLPKGNPTEIKGLMDDLAGRRRTKQPLEFPSGGSTFKRPEVIMHLSSLMKPDSEDLQSEELRYLKSTRVS